MRGIDWNKVNEVQEIIEGFITVKKIKNIYGGLNILRWIKYLIKVNKNKYADK